MTLEHSIDLILQILIVPNNLNRLAKLSMMFRINNYAYWRRNYRNHARIRALRGLPILERSASEPCGSWNMATSVFTLFEWSFFFEKVFFIYNLSISKNTVPDNVWGLNQIFCFSIFHPHKECQKLINLHSQNSMADAPVTNLLQALLTLGPTKSYTRLLRPSCPSCALSCMADALWLICCKRYWPLVPLNHTLVC